ncbi:hypothetical protein HRM2_47360 [Desulforapulum autotrophicum HRM2]|uniref:Uncharacterized protein n=1 Tax=Desulforapulum autotrophicum (strain ATCC 43914 / DSM 3382 / VKM B-1955 / HRM2) TaxID=177437 RepID=C0QHC6_DESAH|nr:hypothetical protein HRM2_47360 [Desulforapulum autotrophicum HRM2]
MPTPQPHVLNTVFLCSTVFEIIGAVFGLYQTTDIRHLDIPESSGHGGLGSTIIPTCLKNVQNSRFMNTG